MIISKKHLVFIIALLIMTIFYTGINYEDVYGSSKVDKLINKAKSKKGKTIKSFPKWFNKGAWCADFVAWSSQKVKLNDNKAFPKKRISSVSSLQKWYKNKKCYSKNTKKSKVNKGDIAFFSTSSHVGIVSAVKGDYVYIVHGNWSNKVQVTKLKKYGYTKSQKAKIKGFACPEVS